MDDFLSIGDFSAECGLSPKMLRSYAAAGLLVPAAVDGSSGYRYYAVSQLHGARLVALLRRAGVGVEEIVLFFAEPDPAQLDRWDEAIVADLSARRQALAQARASLKAGEVPFPTPAALPSKGTPMIFELLAGTATQRGGPHEVNQDATLAGEGVFAVADGIGGLQNGEVASRLALDTLEASFATDQTVSGLLRACRAANEAVWRQATTGGEDPTMGTTLVAVAVTSDAGPFMIHAGDSRGYRYRDGRLDQLTTDHTVVADLIRVGKLTDEEATTHPHRFVLTRALGVGPEVEWEHVGVACRPGDRLVLCSDGLTKALGSDEISRALGETENPQRGAEVLVAEAVRRGVEDDVTAVVVQVR